MPNPIPMIRAWIKSKLPRSLFARAMWILAVPIVVIQIVVATFFAERLFRDVTQQMSSNISLEINYAISQATEAYNKSTAQLNVSKAARSLELDMAFIDELPAKRKDAWLWYDLSGKYVAETLRERILNVYNVDLQSNRKIVNLYLETSKGPMQVSFARTRASATNPHQLLVAMLLTGLLFTGISVMFLNNQIKPIRRLSEASEAFGRGWSIPFTPRGAREVRSAGHSFLAMRSRIIRQIEQRTMMLSGVSHDLRTPLTRMKLSLGLLETSEEIEHLKRDVDEMEAMLTEFLEFSKGDSEEKSETVGIKDMSKKIVRNFKRAGHGVLLVFKGQNIADATLRCRERAIRRAIENLIGNAIRYGKAAQLTVHIKENRVEYIIEDDGPGIPKEKREAAMEPFTRLDESRNQDKGSGSGLGLAITTDIARSHGGKLTMQRSEDLGGLKAVLSIPR